MQFFILLLLFASYRVFGDGAEGMPSELCLAHDEQEHEHEEPFMRYFNNKAWWDSHPESRPAYNGTYRYVAILDNGNRMLFGDTITGLAKELQDDQEQAFVVHLPKNKPLSREGRFLLFSENPEDRVLILEMFVFKNKLVFAAYHHQQEGQFINPAEFQPILGITGDDRRPFVTFLVGSSSSAKRMPLTFLVDTGSPETFIQEEILQELDAKFGPSPLRWAIVDGEEILVKPIGMFVFDKRLAGINLLGLDFFEVRGLEIYTNHTAECTIGGLSVNVSNYFKYGNAHYSQSQDAPYYNTPLSDAEALDFLGMQFRPTRRISRSRYLALKAHLAQARRTVEIP